MNKEYKHIAGLFLGIALGLLVAYVFIPEANASRGYRVDSKNMEIKKYNIQMGDKVYCTGNNYDCEELGGFKN